MIIIDVEQGSPEWFSCRLGKPSASRFSEIYTNTGKESKSRDKYLYELAGERISGMMDVGFKSGYMDRGNALEEEARSTFEFVEGIEVSRVGFCLEDGGRWGASPDGLILPSGGVEIKCKNLALHVECLKSDKVPTQHMAQIQGGMFVAGADHWFFVSYFPGVKMFIKRVERDERYIVGLRSALVAFCEELDSVERFVRGYGQ